MPQARLVHWFRTRSVLLITAAIVLFCVAWVAKDQGSRPPGQFLQYDELFFSSCAARQAVTGWASVAGCHDNKAPVILLAHALVAHGAGAYNADALKLASAGLFTALVVLGAWVASRLVPGRPRTAGLVAGLLLVLALVPRPATLAMKTELMGAFFVLAASAVLLGRPGPCSARRALAAGLAVGLALMSKQTYVLIAPVGLLALLLTSDRAQAWLRRLLPSATFVLGLMLPAAALAALFAHQGKLDEYLYGTFVYPGFYGGDAPPGLARRLLWTGTAFLDLMRFAPTHLVWALLALPVLASRHRANAQPLSLAACTSLRGALLLGGSLLASVAMIIASPLLFESHPIPFWVFASVLGGVVAGHSFASDQPGERRYVQALLLAAALVGASLTLRSNSGQTRPIGDEKLLVAPPGTPVFVLGMAPEFYAYGRFTPASSILYPWALPGTPRSWAFRAPAPEATSAMAVALRAQQQRNLRTLYAEFAQTPPRYIVVFQTHARQPGSSRISDVPGLDDYLQAHCEFLTAVRADQPSNGPGQAFACKTP